MRPQRIPPSRAATTAAKRRFAGCFPRGVRPGRLGGVEPAASTRRFFLADPQADRPQLLPEELRHALGVLRLGPGDPLLGLDGVGGLHPLIVRRATRSMLELERCGEVQREPRPGTAGAPMAWIEVAAALPKGARAESTLGRLTQLGISAFQPLVCARDQGFAREKVEKRGAGLERACREACKQSRRAWVPEIRAGVRPAQLKELYGNFDAVLLSPEAAFGLLHWCATPRSRPVALIAGPEGGFDGAELAELGFAAPARLGPHILRIETAIEAAAATVAQFPWAARA